MCTDECFCLLGNENDRIPFVSLSSVSDQRDQCSSNSNQEKNAHDWNHDENDRVNFIYII